MKPLVVLFGAASVALVAGGCPSSPPAFPAAQASTGATQGSGDDDAAGTSTGSFDASSGSSATHAGQSSSDGSSTTTSDSGADTSTGEPLPSCRGPDGLCHAAAGILPVAGNPEPIAAGDLDGDGNVDLIVGESSTSSIGVLLGMGGGSFADVSLFPLQDDAASLAVADFNGDGLLDLLAAQPGGNRVAILIGDGTGKLEQVATVAGGFFTPEWLVSADFNGDTIPDVAVAKRFTGSLTIALGVGDAAASFMPLPDESLGFSPTSMVTTHAFGDDVGLVITSRLSDRVALHVGDGSGNFEPLEQLVVGNAPVHADLGDVDGDGLADLLTVHRENNTLGVRLGTLKSGWAAPTETVIPAGSRDAAVVDLDLDGALDVVACSDGDEGVFVMRGVGDGTFEQAAFFPSALNHWRLVVTDLNADGIADIASTGREPGGIFLVLSSAS